MEHSKQIVKHVSKITLGTLFSRILGYARDMAIANFFGASFVADAFYVAYRIPNLLRRLLGEGSLSAAFIPIYTDYLSHKSEEEQKKFISTVSFVLFCVLTTITILGIIFAPQILKVIAPGFADYPEKMRLAIILTRVMFPFFIVIGMAALFMGILHSHHMFFISAAAPCFLSIGELVFLFFVCPFMLVPVKGLAFGVVVGGTLQMLFQVPRIIKQKVRFSFNLDFKNEGLRKIVYLMIPSTLAVSVDQINVFVDVMCASWLEVGSVSALYYSNHLTLFPLALFGIAVSSVSLPTLSKSASYENLDEMKSILISSIRLMLYFLIPSSVGLIILAKPIVRALFERGMFDSHATNLTSYALIFYSVGILSFGLVKLLATAFYALKDTKSPVKITSFAMILNVELNLILIYYFKVGGLAFATAISSMFTVFFLFRMLHRKIGTLGLKHLISPILKILLSTIIMGIACYVSAYKIFDANKYLQVFI
ncbi:murein biosynthesis integral membrane protein MurJ, partial [bacterium]